MRISAPSPAQAAILGAPSSYAVRPRVHVKDSGGTWRNLDDLFGDAWLLGAEWNEDVDSAVMELRVTAAAHKVERGFTTHLSLAPLNEDSALNRLTGSYSPLLRLAAECYLEVSVHAKEEEPNAWVEVFRGDLVEVDSVGPNVTFVARDLAGRLARRYIETEEEYGSDAGVAVQTVLQQILDDTFGSSVVPLSTLGSPGFDVGPYAQKRTSVLEALRSLAVDQLGWDLRYGLNLITLKREALYLYEPDREGATVQWTITQDHVHQLRRLGVDLANIRNAVEVTYSDKADLDATGTPKRKNYLLTDAASIAKYGRLFMALAEAVSSNIDTETEAERLATSALSDLSEPLAEIEVDLDCQPFLELNDRVTLEPDGLRYTEPQTLAVVKLTHYVGAGGKHRTTASLRGKPCSGRNRWLTVEQRPGVAPTSPYSGPQAPEAVAVEETTGGVEVVWQPPPSGPRPGDYEVHQKSTPGFTPDSSTLVGTVSGTKMVLTGLAPGVQRYLKVVPKGRNGRDAADLVGTASAEVSATPRYVEPRILQPRVTYAAIPLNADFEAQNDAAAPPDGWDVLGAAIWGGEFSISADANSGTRAVQLGPTATSNPELASQLFVAYPETRYALRARFKSNVATGTPSLVNYPAVQLRWYSDTTTVVSTSGLIPTSVPANAWGTLSGVVTAPATARFARVILTSQTNGATQTILFDSVSVEVASIPLGAATLATLQNSFTDTADATLGAAHHYVDANEHVCLMGAVAHASAPSAGTAILTLPAGRRPTRVRGFAVATNAGAGVVRVAPSGDVTYQSGGVTEFFLDGIRFRTDVDA